MARDYRREYAQRVQRSQDKATAMGIKISKQGAAGHPRGTELTAEEVRNLYATTHARTHSGQVAAGKRVQERYGGGRRRDVPADVVTALRTLRGPDADPFDVIYGGIY
jgi:hypothetical protein